MNNKKKNNKVIIGTTLSVITVILTIIAVIFKERVCITTKILCDSAPCNPIKQYTLFGILLFIIEVIIVIMTIIYNLAGVIKDNDKNNKLYHVTLIIISIIMVGLFIYKIIGN